MFSVAKVEVEVPDAEILAAIDARVTRLQRDNEKKAAQIKNLKAELEKRKDKDAAVQAFAREIVAQVGQYFPDETWYEFGGG